MLILLAIALFAAFVPTPGPAVTEGLDTTVDALDAAGNDDPSSNGVPPLTEITIESITITEG